MVEILAQGESLPQGGGQSWVLGLSKSLAVRKFDDGHSF